MSLDCFCACVYVCFTAFVSSSNHLCEYVCVLEVKQIGIVTWLFSIMLVS